MTPHAVEKYFSMLTVRAGLNVKLNTIHFEMLDEMTALDSGVYTFHYEENGRNHSLPARFTFVYRNGPNGWKIIHHYSSQVPPQINGQ